MDHRAVILDGITVQHVGEVLFDSPATADIRHLCAGSYRRSLEDFAFGVLFGETLTLSSRMPPVGDSTPGAKLLREPALRDFVVSVEMEPPSRVAALLSRTGLRVSVEADLRAIPDLETGFFRDFYIREARGYLGDHPSIREEDLPPAAYTFSTSTRQSHYVEDPALQALAPSAFVSTMVTAIQRTGMTEVADTALQEFVSRALVTHLANYWAFDHAVEGQPHGSARLPHVTRAVIRRKVDVVSSTKESEERLRRLVYRGIVPHALLWVLAVAREKSSFLDALRETRDSRQFREIRRYLTELVTQLGAGKRQDADKLLAEIARKSREGSHEPESLELTIPVVGGVTVGPGVVGEAERRLNPGKYYLRQLIRESGYLGEADYVARVVAMFPDLGPRE